MQKCWEEKYERRPDFSFLAHAMGNMLTECYRKKYDQVNESFFKSDHPAVVRAKPHQPAAVTSSPCDSGVDVAQAEQGEEAAASSTDYIIPIPDQKSEESCKVPDMLIESPSSGSSQEPEERSDSAQQEIVASAPKDEADHSPTQEVKKAENPGTSVEEESFL
ncbi:hypothetical protein SKAU_G00267370 [Synaphobranchus kaupii]|uniref:Uncharacterized protein n=1 Tax=Synaphobranchus kaupii TaxID=118154 RepID=A0A9Q1IN74_SYNKA|nr:hypothetical protein SKAU_G00267370 [Synaphobranchus kaupii]